MIVELERDEEGNLVAPIPEEMLKELDWKAGDVLLWEEQPDGTYIIRRKGVW